MSARTSALLILGFVAGASKQAAAQCPTESFRVLSSGTTGEFFGEGLSTNAAGDVFLAGAPLHTVNGSFSGAAYVRRFDGTSWLEQLLVPSDGQPNDVFGWKTALDGVGDTGLIGTQYGAGGAPGGAYVFQFDGTVWTEQVKLLPSDPSNITEFGGRGVELNDDGTVALIAANGPGFNESGCAYVFRYDGNAWVEEHKFTTPETPGTSFAFDIAIDAAGDTVAILGQTAVYVSEYDGTSWSALAVLAPHFGWFALDGTGTRAAVGDFSQLNDLRFFRFDGSAWVLEERIAIPDSIDALELNWAGDVLALGAEGSSPGPGAVYRYGFDGTRWNLTGQLSPEISNETMYGRRVLLDASGAVTIVSAPRPGRWPVYVQVCAPSNTFCAADGCPCGNDAFVHGCDNGATQGGLYLRERSFDPVGGSVELVATGFPSGSSPAAIAVRSGNQASASVLGDGLLCLATPVRRIRSGVPQNGTLSLLLQHGAGAGTFHYQLWYRSTGPFCPPAQFNLSNGVSLTWQ